MLVSDVLEVLAEFHQCSVCGSGCMLGESIVEGEKMGKAVVLSGLNLRGLKWRVIGGGGCVGRSLR